MQKFLSIITVFILIITLSTSACAVGYEDELPAVFLGEYALPETAAFAEANNTDHYEEVVQNIEVEAVEIDGVYDLPRQAPVSEIIPRAYSSFTFDNLAGQNFVSDNIVHTLDNPGVAKLRVSSCTWLPARYEIVIGLYNISTGKIYGVQYSNTSVSNVNITTENCPVGDYYVIVKNNEASNLIISDGIISYNLY